MEFTHSNYDDIKAVRSIWICLDGKENEDSINRIELTTKNIFGQKSNFNNINKLQAVIIKLREAQNVEVSKNRLIAMLEELVSKDDTETKKKRVWVSVAVSLAGLLLLAVAVAVFVFVLHGHFEFFGEER